MLDFDKLLFDGPDVTVRTVLIGIAAYFSIILIIRISGKRSLSQLNSFDFIVTVAIGSILASALIDQNVTIAQGVTAFMILMIMQYLITKLSFSSSLVNRYIKASPSLLYCNGEFLYNNMKKERIVETEIKQGIRSNGTGHLFDVMAVVLETDGTLSIITKNSEDDYTDLDSPLFSEVKKISVPPSFHGGALTVILI